MGKQVVDWTMLPPESLEEDPLQPFHTSCGPRLWLGTARISPTSSSLPLPLHLLASFLIFLFILCVVSVHILICAHVWRPEADISCLLQLFSTLIFK